MGCAKGSCLKSGRGCEVCGYGYDCGCGCDCCCGLRSCSYACFCFCYLIAKDAGDYALPGPGRGRGRIPPHPGCEMSSGEVRVMCAGTGETVPMVRPPHTRPLLRSCRSRSATESRKMTCA
jgi:hypothetical protein